jgi:hypothetical protein
VATTSTIQLVPIQAWAIYSGACLACSVQVMVRPWLISRSVAKKGILRFPWNWLRIWRCSVFWFAYSFGEAFG